MAGAARTRARQLELVVSLHRSPHAALVMSLVGSAWTVNANALSQAGVNSLSTVSCASAALCVAAGSSAASFSATPKVLLGDVEGLSWHQLEVARTSGYVKSIACVATSGCRVVALAGSTTLIASFSGETWTSQQSPIP